MATIFHDEDYMETVILDTDDDWFMAKNNRNHEAVHAKKSWFTEIEIDTPPPKFYLKLNTFYIDK